MGLLFRKKAMSQNTPKVVLLLTLVLILVTIIPLCYPMISPSFTWGSLSSSSSSSSSDHGDVNHDSSIKSEETCDIFTGEWVRNLKAPYYTNRSCWAIHDHQNCMRYGRPDTDFMKWRWKPDGCELPVFNPVQFLKLVGGKSMAFVGDSVGRNQMQSLICLLSRVQYPIDVSYTPDDKFKRWKYTDYNFTLATLWSPYLVRAKEADPDGPALTGLFNLYLDEFDEIWTTQIEEFDYIIISAGHWFFRPSVYYEGGQVVGCSHCQIANVTDLTMYYGYQKAFRTAFQAINRLKNFRGTTFLRTFSPSHFENGVWNQGGNCVRTRPFRSNETRLDGFNLELYMTQLGEFNVAKEEGRKRGLKYRLLDTTQAMLLRPDGHPSRYGHWPNENVTLYNDCVHWCLPGPIDSWNDFLLHMLKMEGGRSDGKIHNSYRKLGSK